MTMNGSENNRGSRRLKNGGGLSMNDEYAMHNTSNLNQSNVSLNLCGNNMYNSGGSNRSYIGLGK